VRVRVALRSNPGRDDETVRTLQEALKALLIDRPSSHSAVFGAQDAEKVGLPVINCEPSSYQWQLIWRLWTRYFAMGATRGVSVYESSWTPQVHPQNS
jgi:hypothetical protein